jgi:acyl-CoA synthetase (AMP-forming)/AMP-acid ligase II/acyl carrier protein
VTLFDLPVAFWREVIAELAASPEPRGPFGGAPVRAFLTGGESLSKETLMLWAGLALGPGGLGPETFFLSSYGPTETTVTTTAFTLTAGEVAGLARATIPLGRPLPGTEVYLLGAGLRPVPLGVPGDVWIGGAGVTRGYLDRPEPTAAAFLPDLFGGRPGARLYRTGDRARWLAGGQLEFLGRGDDQVKIRGFRVELGEIESALARHPAVLQAVAIVRDDLGGPADRRLVAYVVPAPDAVPAGETPDGLTPGLRSHLRESLPEPMVPSRFVYLERLPVTPGGKVDRRNLPRPEAGPALEREYVAPRDGVEEALAGIWQGLLGVERVGVHDNFFELGGHSLLGTRVISALREAFGVEVPLRALFEKPTVADLALAVTQARLEGADSSELGALLENLEGLSDEEVEALLAASEEEEREEP